jgi:U3 small nucleolar RNA-associated protein 19
MNTRVVAVVALLIKNVIYRYLPSYVVAAFVKRLARLALSAPAAGAILAIALMYLAVSCSARGNRESLSRIYRNNMMIQHTEVQVLLHNALPPSQETVPILLVGSAATEAGVGPKTGADPYIFEEADPAACQAIKSSLWEIKALQSHTHPGVSKLARAMEGKLQNVYVMKDYAVNTYQSLFLSEFEKKQKGFPIDLEDSRQSSLFTTNDSFGNWKWQ